MFDRNWQRVTSLSSSVNIMYRIVFVNDICPSHSNARALLSVLNHLTIIHECAASSKWPRTFP